MGHSTNAERAAGRFTPMGSHGRSYDAIGARVTGRGPAKTQEQLAAAAAERQARLQADAPAVGSLMLAPEALALPEQPVFEMPVNPEQPAAHVA